MQFNRSPIPVRRHFAVSIVAAILFAIIPAAGQGTLVPHSDADLDELGGGFQLVELFASQCEQFTCPNMDCSEAANLAAWLMATKSNLMLYAFWLSKAPQFETDSRFQTRYRKSVALIRRIDNLLGKGDGARVPGGSVINCFNYLGDSCDVLKNAKTRIARESEGFVTHPSEEVVFPSNGDPSEGTAKTSEIWAQALGRFEGFVRPRLFFNQFSMPEEEVPSISTTTEEFEPSVSHLIEVYVPRCYSNTVDLILVSKSADRVEGTSIDQLWYKNSNWMFDHGTVVIPPVPPNSYELKFVDRSTGIQYANSKYAVTGESPLIGKWSNPPNLRIEFRLEKGGLTAYRTDGKTDELLCRDFELYHGDEAGGANYRTYCSVEGEKSNWRTFTMSFSDSNLLRIEGGMSIIFGDRTRVPLLLTRMK